MTRWFVAFALASLCGCASLPEDDFDAAGVLLERGDLLGTILRLDRVPPSDPRYPQSRTIANAIERRVRLSQGLLNRGLQLRAEWRDLEAVSNFEQALEIWPELDAASAMLEATRHRIGSLEAGDDNATAGGEVVHTSPVAEARPDAETIAVPDPGASDANPAFGDDRTRMLEIDRLLDDGLLEGALQVAESGPSLAPSPLRGRLTEMLHQRALVHYGHGALDLALNDWVRLLRIDANHAQAKEFSAAARAELVLR